MKRRIVWIDDDTHIYDDLIDALRDDYEVISMQSAQQAVGSLDVLEHCDLIILDMIIPDGQGQLKFGHYTGKDLLAALQHDHGIKTPVLALTVVERDEVRRELRRLGVRSILLKPILRSELREAVADILEPGGQ